LRAEDGWTTDKPDPELHNQYIDKLKEACKSMNEAGVAHLDLHPDNIM